MFELFPLLRGKFEFAHCAIAIIRPFALQSYRILVDIAIKTMKANRIVTKRKCRARYTLKRKCMMSPSCTI
ncbi:hypothetical protein SAMN05660226_01470 [Parapedobacter luteus]|uniref:Uncharacterized protein n=1 Tax=Parapedobacter luteus TaxID=623280 RepID=A0A1T5BGW6_9SPHI|nr:hypothetical protein SAMN05660226_01470 [Parapedobacter luteus]